MSSTVNPERIDPDERDDPAARRRRSRRGSALDMVRSMAVIVGVVAVVVLLVPRPNAQPSVSADVAGAARQVETQVGFAPAVPQGLPDGWKPVRAGLRHSVDDALTWHVEYLTPQGRYASIEQAVRPTKQWEIVLDSGGTDRTPQTVAGRTWIQRYKPEREVTALILRGEGHTTMVTSKSGGLADATVLAGSLPASSL